MRAFSFNPLIAREIRARWRDGRSFSLVFALVAGLSLLFVWLYRSQSEFSPLNGSSNAQWALLGHQLFGTLTWVQTVTWLLLSPALTSSSIAYERERGWFDSLLLSPLLPRQIAWGKWVSALLFAAILYALTLPFAMLTLLLGGVSPAQFWIALSLHTLCATFGAAVGLATSSWNIRSHVALRSAYAIILLWLATSLAAASVSGEGPFARVALGLLGPSRPSLLNQWWGHSNPILVALQLNSGAPESHFGSCFAFLGAATLFFLGIAAHYCRQPLQEAPFIASRPKKRADVRPTHGQIPLVTRLKFRNPVLDREVRAKFRMRQPPMVIIIVEALLGVLVAVFYFRTLYMAVFDPNSRFLVWWGLIFTGLIVTMMAAAVMGSNGFSREREGGTWQSIQLSLLSPGEIIGGKIGASMLACGLFSLPVWPLLLPCVAWTAGATALPSRFVEPLQALACLFIWSSTAWSYSCIGLWMGRRQARSARASGQTLGVLTGLLILSPIVIFGADSESMIYSLAVIHPFVALIMTVIRTNVPLVFVTGLPYFAFHLALGWFFLIWLRSDITRDFKGLSEAS